MGKWRSKEQKINALVRWQRSKNHKCPKRAALDQDPLPVPKIGDYVITWNDETDFWMTPPVSRRAKCGCPGRHRPGNFFWIVQGVDKSALFCVKMNEPWVERVIYQSSVLLNIGS